jgi:hypothetical protein
MGVLEMSVLLMVTLEVDSSRSEEMVLLFRKRHDQSIRLGALSHDLYRLVDAGDDAGKWMGTMTFRDMEHFNEFVAAQEADPEATATIASGVGPGGFAKIVGQRVAVLIP